MWVKENRKDVARKLAGRFVWVSAGPLSVMAFRGRPGNTYCRNVPKKTRTERKAWKHDRVILVKARGGRHVMHMLHAIRKAGESRTEGGAL